MNIRSVLRPGLVGLTLLFGVFVLLQPRPLHAAAPDEERSVKPVTPAAEYLSRKELMSAGMMPNYKALWSGFRSGDMPATKTAAKHLATLAKMTRRFSSPTSGGSAADFQKRTDELIQNSEALVADLPTLTDRSALSSRIMTVYQTCQGCHEAYAPKEGAERRKYSPPM